MSVADWAKITSRISEKVFEDLVFQETLRIDSYRNPQEIEKKRLEIVLPLHKIHRERHLNADLNGERVEIWFVDGAFIRRRVDIDFTMGGHAFRYLYIPTDEVWIDGVFQDYVRYDNEEVVNVDSKDSEPTIWHELFERDLMRAGTPYNVAHDQASAFETAIRRNKVPDDLLRLKGWNPKRVATKTQ